MTRTRVMSRERKAECGFYAKRQGQSTQSALALLSPASARVPGLVPRDLQSQSSVNASQAMLSQAMLSQAMLSQATLSHTTLSHATLSQTTLSQAKLSQAMLSQTRVSQVSRNQGMPPSKGSCHCSGEPKRTGYSARAKPSAGRSP